MSAYSNLRKKIQKCLQSNYNCIYVEVDNIEEHKLMHLHKFNHGGNIIDIDGIEYYVYPIKRERNKFDDLVNHLNSSPFGSHNHNTITTVPLDKGISYPYNWDNSNSIFKR